jgi:hypothetical protein
MAQVLLSAENTIFLLVQWIKSNLATADGGFMHDFY